MTQPRLNIIAPLLMGLAFTGHLLNVLIFEPALGFTNAEDFYDVDKLLPVLAHPVWKMGAIYHLMVGVAVHQPWLRVALLHDAIEGGQILNTCLIRKTTRRRARLRAEDIAAIDVVALVVPLKERTLGGCLIINAGAVFQATGTLQRRPSGTRVLRIVTGIGGHKSPTESCLRTILARFAGVPRTLVL